MAFSVGGIISLPSKNIIDNDCADRYRFITSFSGAVEDLQLPTGSLSISGYLNLKQAFGNVDIYITTLLHNIANSSPIPFFVKYFFKEGKQYLAYHICFLFSCHPYLPYVHLYFSLVLQIFFLFLWQILSLSCSHLFTHPIHRTVCPSPLNIYIVINFLIQLFICTVASTKTNRSGPSNSRKCCCHVVKPAWSLGCMIWSQSFNDVYWYGCENLIAWFQHFWCCLTHNSFKW